MKNSIKILIGLALLAITSQAQAVATLAGGCAITDLTTSTDCAGVYDPGNDNGVHTIFTDATFQSTFPGTWTELVKLEDPTWNVPNSIDFSLTGQGSTSGTWQVASTAWDSFAQGEVIDLSVTSGTWSVNSTAWDGSGLSHFTFFTKPGGSVPEPSILALLSLGAFGLFLSARRNRKM